MPNAYQDLSENILARKEFLEDYQSLFASYVHKTIGDPHDEVPRDISIRLARAAQILVASGIPKYIDVGVRIIDMFLELDPPYLEDLLVIAEEMFSLLGDFPNIALIDRRWAERAKLEKTIPGTLASQMHRDMNSIEALEIDGTNFQADLWGSLEDGNDVVAVAPTSTGKSYIIMEHLVHYMTQNKDQASFAVYVVPSRALIHEVSRKIQQALAGKGIDWVEVATIGQRDRSYENSTIFVLTQERLLMLLHFQQLMTFSYVVVDEAQNIASDSRGVLLHIALSRIMGRGRVRLVFSTPSEDYKDCFTSLLSQESEVLATPHSPVGKNIIEVSWAARNIVLKSTYPPAEVRVPKGFAGKGIPDTIARLGSEGRNIIYSNTTPMCEKLAAKLSLSIPTQIEALRDAADYVRATIHEDTALASCIEKGVAYHYGPLPRHARIMIESEVEGGNIDYLVCTSTLAEGVNLPGKNLFIYNPKIAGGQGESDRPMPRVQYKNIVGRAGRLMTHFSGNVFLLDFDSWSFPECADSAVEPQMPTYIRVLQDDYEAVIGELTGADSSNTLDRSALSATISKLIQDEQQGVLASSLQNYISDASINEITAAVNSLLSGVELPSAILELNPGIGVRQQNTLCTLLLEHQDLSKIRPVYPQSSEFPAHLQEVAELTYQCGVLQLSGLDNERFMRKVMAIAVPWVRGVPIKTIISNVIRTSKYSSVDSAIRNTVKLLNNGIGFHLATAVKCFTQIYMYCADVQGIDTDDVPEIYPFLELGASDVISIRLISSGLSRESALQVRDTIPDLAPDDNNILQTIIRHSNYRKLHSMARREIESLRR